MSAPVSWRRASSLAMLLIGFAAAVEAQTPLAGPDSAGYRAYTYPAYLRDVSVTGTSVPLADDQMSAAIDLPFTFWFYGTPVTSVQVSPNGFLRFPPAAPGGSSQHIAAGDWTDLNVSQGNIRYHAIGAAPERQFVVGFYGVPHASNGPRVTFEMILHEGTDAIEFQYGNSPSDHQHTQSAGIQDSTGAAGLQLAAGQVDFSNQGFYIAVGAGPAAIAGPDASDNAAYKVGAHLRDVSTNGAAVSLGDDQVGAPIPLPFAFDFYGATATSVQISSNGFLRFAPDDYEHGCCFGGALPGGTAVNIAAGYWSDLYAPLGNIRYGTVGTAPHRRFVVGFYNVPHYGNVSFVTFEMILHEGTNAIEFQYGDAPGGQGNTHSIGIQNPDRTQGVQIAQDRLDLLNTGFLVTRTVATNSDPTSEAGADQTLEAVDAAGASFTLHGSGSDSDSDPLTFTWTGPFGTVTSNPLTVTLPPPAVGRDSVAYEITLTVDDGRGGTATDTVWLTVTDTTAPVIRGIPAPIVLEATSPAGAAADFGPLSAGDAVDGTRAVNCSHEARETFPLGTTAVTCTSADLHGNSLRASFDVSVRDTTAPAVGPITPSQVYLSSPNHALVDVQLTYGVTDAVSTPACTAAVASNEPSNGTGDGNTTVDWVIVDATRVRLRAERAGSGNGRVYTLTVTCSDAAGNRSTGATAVYIPKGRSK